jgi:hypothetical protein
MVDLFGYCGIDKTQDKVLRAEFMLADYQQPIELIGEKLENIRGYL